MESQVTAVEFVLIRLSTAPLRGIEEILTQSVQMKVEIQGAKNREAGRVT